MTIGHIHLIFTLWNMPVLFAIILTSIIAANKIIYIHKKVYLAIVKTNNLFKGKSSNPVYVASYMD